MPYYSTKGRGAPGLAIVGASSRKHGESIEVGDNVPGFAFVIELAC